MSDTSKTITPMQGMFYAGFLGAVGVGSTMLYLKHKDKNDTSSDNVSEIGAQQSMSTEGFKGSSENFGQGFLNLFTDFGSSLMKGDAFAVSITAGVLAVAIASIMYFTHQLTQPTESKNRAMQSM